MILVLLVLDRDVPILFEKAIFCRGTQTNLGTSFRDRIVWSCIHDSLRRIWNNPFLFLLLYFSFLNVCLVLGAEVGDPAPTVFVVIHIIRES